MYDSHNDSLVNDERLNYEMIFSPRLRLQHLPFSKNEYFVNDERLNYEMIFLQNCGCSISHIVQYSIQYMKIENYQLLRR